MRRFQQKKILELLQTLNEANAEIKRFFSRKDFDSLMQVLSDCQEFAVQIGSFIESIQGEGTETVALLEKYCTLLYETSIEAGKEKSDNKFVKRLQKQLIKIENSVKDELKSDKLEIVFFPYNASMWDSLESIWIAAKDDPSCDAFVVPLPHYDVLPDGSFGQMHYDGTQYPNYVPVADWRSYNVVERHPDVIFIHYAYDDNTSNASIPPDFYSKRLREHCELLIYIPYYISTGGAVAEYCGYLPGVLYANHVIVESEAVRQSYIGHYKNFDQNHGCKGQFGKAEEKFIALGSPKFDKVLNAKRADYELPAEWSRLIYKPDGSRKKVVLYNTHMFTWLNGGEEYFKKLRYVFEVIRGRDDVVLWWRPHPNTELNFRTKRPQWLNEYNSLVDGYKRGGWGIYDDTPDLHRALSVSDCYYGDWSSLVGMYQYTGKPILIQVMRAYNAANHLLASRVFLNEKDTDTIWAASMSFNGLYRIDLRTFSAEFIGCFPNEKQGLQDPYLSGTRLGDILYFAPFYAEQIATYNTVTGDFSNISLPVSVVKPEYTNEYPKFRGTIAFGRYIFFLPQSYPAILRYDTSSGEFEQFTDWIPSFEKLDNGTKDVTPIYFCNHIVIGEEILTVFRNSNVVVVFNMEKCISTVYEVDGKDRTYSGICFDGEHFWLSPFDGGVIVRWNRQTGEWKEYATDFGYGLMSFWGGMFANGYVWMLPYTGKAVLRIDPGNENIEVVTPLQEILDEADIKNGNIAFIAPVAMNGRILAFYNRSAEFVEYSPETGELRRQSVTVDRLSSVNFATRYGDLMENGMYTLYDYLDDIVSWDDSDEMRLELSRKRRESISNGDGTAGEKIYAMLKKKLMEG